MCPCCPGESLLFACAGYVHRPPTQQQQPEDDVQNFIDSDDDSDDEMTPVTRARVGPRYHAVTPHQEAYIAKNLAKVRNGGVARLSNVTIYPGNPIMGSCSGDANAHCLAPVTYWAPQHFDGVPSQPPCPECGWSAVEQNMVEARGWIPPSKARRVSGISEDEFLMGTRHRLEQSVWPGQHFVPRVSTACCCTQIERSPAWYCQCFNVSVFKLYS
jgi:hypothetical protein